MNPLDRFIARTIARLVPSADSARILRIRRNAALAVLFIGFITAAAVFRFG